MLMSDTTQVSPSVLQPLGFNELLLHRPQGSPGQALLDSLSIPAVLSSILVDHRRAHLEPALLGFQHDLRAPAPVVIMYGIWAFFAFR